ncbi:MAG: 4'-phosphopantetheinyl transferase superfamily protein [Thaumarchaeota archaeon]|nr:4'-phosphopantetheinyl transferase superfamily protein [Nitrososphaerota archaeon]MDE1877815.1 4'-phosphopantetheinyl transferase superfamily protein [Nitrososphaerota archaeon]
MTHKFVESHNSYGTQFSANEIHLWCTKVVNVDSNQNLLSNEDLHRIALFHREEDRSRVAAGITFLRHLMAGYTGIKPQTLKFTRNCRFCGSHDHGKPRLSWPSNGPRFNVSHAGNLILIAVSWFDEVGVDVEVLPNGFTGEESAHLVFGPRELAEFKSQTGEERNSTFGRLWCRKEAFLKAHGLGLGGYPTLVDVSTISPDVLVAHDPISKTTFSCHDIEIETPYFAAVVKLGGPSVVRTFLWPSDKSVLHFQSEFSEDNITMENDSNE